MKKKTLLLLTFPFFLAGCNINLPFLSNNKTNQGGKKVEHIQEVTEITDEGPEELTQHATKVYPDPKAPFYLKVDENRRIGVTFDYTPTNADEKTFRWSLEGDNIEYTPCEDAPTKADIVGKKAGSCVLSATNIYNESLVAKFFIKVIDFDEETDYLWQYASSDKAQFGYTTDTKAGIASGTANLNGMEWDFVRSNVSSLNTSTTGYLGFGKGAAPETHIHFESTNARTVNFISIEAISANSLAKMTIKVGETTYLDNATVPKKTDDVAPIICDDVTPAAGKIEIDIETPAYDSSRKEDPTYREPGGFFIKSILIDFDGKLPDKTMTLVTSATDIEAGAKYLILGHSSVGYGALDGTLSSSVKETPYLFSQHVTDYPFMESFELQSNVTVPAGFDKFAFVASFDENEKLNFTSSGGIKIGLAGSGTLSTTAKPALLGWDYSIDSSNHLLMSMYDTESTPKLRHFGVNNDSGKFSSYASASNNIYLYKF